MEITKPRKFSLLIMSVMIITMACSKKDDPTPINEIESITPSVNNGIDTIGEFNFNGATHYLIKNSLLYYYNQSSPKLIITPNNSIQNTSFLYNIIDSIHMPTMMVDGSTRNFEIIQTITVFPTTYDKCTFQIIENLGAQNEIRWYPQSSGWLTVTKNSTKYTFNCISIMMEDTINNLSKPASINFTITM